MVHAALPHPEMEDIREDRDEEPDPNHEHEEPEHGPEDVQQRHFRFPFLSIASAQTRVRREHPAVFQQRAGTHRQSASRPSHGSSKSMYSSGSNGSLSRSTGGFDRAFVSSRAFAIPVNGAPRLVERSGYFCFQIS